ncbi:MAG: alkyl hydroperoxide reductase/Thiol specific antioxidant/Mal allergen [Proteobacteria bacterium]|nr:alkyl hydroperoxide reductase/Thiol specific antioxidant/Mal allergen [Pseudomonadota bacterium]
MLQAFFRVFLITLALVTGSAIAAPRVGEPAPDFTGVDTQGKTHRLADYRGKTVVLEWTNHDCPYVRKHYGAGNLQEQQREAAAQGVIWLSVISSAPGQQGHVSPAEADELTRSRKAAPHAVLLDPEGRIGRAYEAKTTPHMYIIDEVGKLVYLGGIDSLATADPADIPKATQYVRVALKERAAGQPISAPVTRSYGCSVKY